MIHNSYLKAFSYDLKPWERKALEQLLDQEIGFYKFRKNADVGHIYDILEELGVGMIIEEFPTVYTEFYNENMYDQLVYKHQ